MLILFKSFLGILLLDPVFSSIIFKACFASMFMHLTIWKFQCIALEPKILSKRWFTGTLSKLFFSYAIFTWIWTLKTNDGAGNWESLIHCGATAADPSGGKSLWLLHGKSEPKLCPGKSLSCCYFESLRLWVQVEPQKPRSAFTGSAIHTNGFAHFISRWTCRK